MTTQSLMQVVTDLITRLEAGTLGEGFREPLQRGSARGLVGVIRDPTEQDHLLMVVRWEIMQAPVGDREAFNRHLLALNHGLLGRAAFSIDPHGTVYLSSGRPMEDLDPSEIVDLLLWSSHQADHYDDVLLEAFPPSDP